MSAKYQQGAEEYDRLAVGCENSRLRAMVGKGGERKGTLGTRDVHWSMERQKDGGPGDNRNS